jgi:hypothetical protein
MPDVMQRVLELHWNSGRSTLARFSDSHLKRSSLSKSKTLRGAETRYYLNLEMIAIK